MERAKHLIDMSVDRGAYVCQSQSLNLWVEDPNYNVLTSMHFYAWKKGLKTGIYYLRRKAKHQAQQFTVDVVDHATGAGASMSSSNHNHNHNVSPLANADPDAEPTGSGYEECEFCSS